jgi:hypothetical protein
MDHEIRFSLFVGAPLLAIVAIIALGIAFASCQMSWQDSGREWRWHIIAGCQVKDGTGWVPAGSVRTL